jgi:rfaE bifunctional protein nucleotidyltransferase chain/domain
MIPVESPEMYQAENILSLERASQLVLELKASGKTVGLCHGVFDLLHPGHAKHFESAKKLCDILFVSLTADRFVTLRKGPERPILSAKLRAYMIANLKFVDYVIILDYPKGTEVIEALKPSFYIKGPDIIHLSTLGINEEREMVKKIGGEMRYTNDPKLSTTEIIEYIKHEIK